MRLDQDLLVVVLVQLRLVKDQVVELPLLESLAGRVDGQRLRMQWLALVLNGPLRATQWRMQILAVISLRGLHRAKGHGGMVLVLGG